SGARLGGYRAGFGGSRVRGAGGVRDPTVRFGARTPWPAAGRARLAGPDPRLAGPDSGLAGPWRADGPPATALPRRAGPARATAALRRRAAPARAPPALRPAAARHAGPARATPAVRRRAACRTAGTSAGVRRPDAGHGTPGGAGCPSPSQAGPCRG